MMCEPKPGTSALHVGAALEGPEALEQSCGGTEGFVFTHWSPPSSNSIYRL